MTDQRVTAAEVLRRRAWYAAANVADHELLDERYWDEGRGARWLIGVRGSGIGRTEIVAGIFDSLVVHGDYPLCRFGFGARSAWATLCWMAAHPLPDSYVREKAAIGTGRLYSDGYDERVALTELDDRIAELHEEDSPNGKLIDLLRDAKRHAETEHELRAYLSEHDEGWDLWEWRLGDVAPHNVVQAHACIQRCAWLLQAKHGPYGPPECGHRPGQP